MSPLAKPYFDNEEIEEIKKVLDSCWVSKWPKTKEFEEAFKDVSSSEISKVEEELIKEGMPREEIFKLCDVHMAVIKDSMDKEKTEVPEGHPVNILMEEHKMLLHFASELKMMAGKIKGAKDLESARGALEHLGHLVEHFKESESHYLREENVLFPTLENLLF